MTGSSFLGNLRSLGVAVSALATACGAADLPRHASPSARAVAIATSGSAAPVQAASAPVVHPPPSSANPDVLPSASAPTRPSPLKGMPDVKVELDPPIARPAALCSIHGTDRPFDSGCATQIVVASDARAKTPMVVFTPRSITVTFDVSKDASVAAVTMAAGGVRVEGFVDITAMAFHLAKEATALGGHAHLLAGDPVTISRADAKSVFVRAHDDTFNIEDVEAATTCDAVRFDGFQGTPTLPPAPSGNLGAARGGLVHLKGAPGETTFFTLRVLSSSNPFFMTEIEKKGADAHVSFSTRWARFDAWIDQTEIDFGDIGAGIGIGSGTCGTGVPLSSKVAFQVIDDTDVLVADEPGKRGPSGVRLAKGISVVAREAHGGWAEIAIEPRVVVPAPGLHFFVPWGALRDPAPAPSPPMDRE